MRITEQQLRRFIREEILRESPFDEFIPHIDSKNPPHTWRPSIAHSSARKKHEQRTGDDYTDIVKGLMSKTEDNWVIITPADVSSRASLDSDEFHTWLDGQRKLHPPGTIFAFAASASFDEDETSPAWAVVHDLFGHTLDVSWQGKRPREFPDPIPESIIVGALHSALPDKFRISDNDQDMLPDVLAAILLRVLKRVTAHAAIRDSLQGRYTAGKIEAAIELVDAMFSVVEQWLGYARADGFVKLMPW